ncbi:unnamed protein product [Cuscuta campestris]|uniref:Uncharacterized protein n=2 Tax=Cuscuta sect. Cleistogrammica TaxID=1824901 RepID=A0A484NAC9_9ASTE|nr:hypothetical protein DM860_000852 [Cuscuta australis]VFQ97527.1 unnamed protein product [Cuscuta campestris]
MGSCASSAHRDQETQMKRRIGSKLNNLVTPSPVDGDCKVTASDRPPKSPPSPLLPPAAASVDSDREDEKFFDSQLYLESDCDDDFHSVKGDFTPSRGSTPIHHRFSAGPMSPKVKRVFFTERIPISAPLRPPSEERKKRLEELFKESLGGDNEFDNAMNEPNASNKSAFGTPNYSSPAGSYAGSSPIQQTKHASPGAGKRARQWCFPIPKSLLSRCSFSEAKKTPPPPPPRE